jgi:uncharacterized YccA/Bax inhibitor family protein
MAFFKSSNPALGEETFAKHGVASSSANAMTMQGTANKTAILLLLACCSALWTWNIFFNALDVESARGAVAPWMIGGAIGGFIVAMITIFKQEWAYITAPIYAILEGLFLGGISAYFEAAYGGIVIQAVLLTLTTFVALLVLYKTGLVRATENFKLIVTSATGGIALVYLVNMILSMFGMQIPYIHESGVIGIGFSLLVTGIAALNLVMDFDFIEEGEKQQAPKFMEWYAAFGLMVTLVWLYIEFLKLLSKLRND